MKAKRIAIFGLNGAGKSFLSQHLKKELDAIVWDGDAVRSGIEHDDFSLEGRLKQGRVMDFLSRTCVEQGQNSICSFIAPLEETKQLFYDDSFIIFVDTIKPEENRYQDTGQLFQTPTLFHYRVTSKTNDVENLIRDILVEFHYWCAKSQTNYNI
jgi:adenylylsulfate kinase-like enzyme